MRPIAASLSDEELMSGLRLATDRESTEIFFGEVFNRYHGRVVSWCHRVVKNRDTAHDLAQEVFLKAYRHRAAFRGESRFSTWLYAIARNHCLTAAKKLHAGADRIEPIGHAGLRDAAAIKPDLAAERGELYQGMRQLMARTLDPMEIRVMMLHYGHEVPLATITRKLALTNPSGAKAYIVNARRKLQNVLRRRKLQREYWRDEMAA
jgi:RNA polymerase sigma-70 factor (ECF subfamily)